VVSPEAQRAQGDCLTSRSFEWQAILAWQAILLRNISALASHPPLRHGASRVVGWVMLTWLFSRFWKLPKATNAVDRQLGVAVPMRDGVSLVTDIYSPRGVTGAPTILVRSPYGRGTLFGIIAGLFAEHGYIVVIQSCRGTFGSGGTFNPFFQERADGVDAVGWIETQPWYNGKLGLYGPSYLGQVQWTVAAELGERISAMCTVVTSADFHASIHDGGGFRLEDFLSWSRQVATQESSSVIVQGLREMLFGNPLTEKFTNLPLNTIDQTALGYKVDYWPELVDHPNDDAFWEPLHDTKTFGRVTAPVSMLGGWSDLFIQYQVRDYKALKALGKTTRITIGPWTHTNFGAVGASIRDALEWFDIYLRGRAPEVEELSRVRLWVHGTDVWRDYPAWPTGKTEHLTLGADRSLAASAAQGGTYTFTYDPKKPTPSLEGAKLTSRTGRGDTQTLSARPDVLSFDGPVLTKPFEIVGDVAVTLKTTASAPHHDIFVVLCDVDSAGKAINITDGYLRMDDTALTRETVIPLLPTAWRMEAGHRLRLLVAGGAFPKFARNLGTGEPLGSGTRMQAVDITVHCGDGSGLSFGTTA